LKKRDSHAYQNGRHYHFRVFPIQHRAMDKYKFYH